MDMMAEGKEYGRSMIMDDEMFTSANERDTEYDRSCDRINLSASFVGLLFASSFFPINKSA